MSVSLSPIGNSMIPFLTTAGLPLAAGQLYSYAAGTTTPQTTYTSNTGSVPNTNPIVLGTNGIAPNPIWLTDNVSYKFVLADASNNVLETYDNINGQGTISGNLTVGGTLTANAITCTTNETIGGNLTVSGSITAGSFTGIGKTIKQIVTFTGNPGSFNSSSWVATSMTATITPTSTSSQILILASFTALALGSGNQGGSFTLYRNGTTNLAGGSTVALSNIENGSSTPDNQNICGFNWIDSPTTTSATTYTVYGTSTCLIVTGPGLYGSSSATTTTGSFILMEIV
jgi:hypothetical protein